MDNTDSERIPEQPKTERDRLTVEAQQLSRAIASYEKSLADDRAFFADRTKPIDQFPQDRQIRYENMLSTERKLTIVQQKHSTILLKLIGLASDQLDSDVKSLGSSVERLGWSSRRLEILTGILILVTVVAVSEAIAVNASMPLWAILAALVPTLGYLIIRRRNWKFTRGDSNR